MADPASLIIAYPPIKRIIKLEILEEQQEANSFEEENWALQLPKDSVELVEPSKPVAHPPIKSKIKLENLDDHQGLTSDDSGQSKESLQDNQPTVNVVWEGETLQDTEMMEKLDSEDEGSEYDEGSEHSSLEDFDESDNSLADLTDDEDSITSSNAGLLLPSLEPTRPVQKESHRKEKDDSSNGKSPGMRPFKCRKCEQSYQLKSSLISHSKYSCGTEPQFSCTQCGRKFKRKDNLQTHLIKVHKIDRKQLDQHGAGLSERPFKCTKCDSAYKQKRALDHHTKNECGVSFHCSICRQIYATKSSLRSHLLSVHQIARHRLDKYGAGFKDRPSTHQYKCDQCKRAYKNKKSLVNHLNFECRVDPSFPCPRCNCQCKHKFSLKRHLIEIHKVEPSQLASFGLGPVLDRSENQFKCYHCGTSYKHKKHLNRHLVQKCGKKP